MRDFHFLTPLSKKKGRTPPFRRLTCLIFFESDCVSCRNLSTILNFICARAYPNQHLWVVPRHFHINARASGTDLQLHWLVCQLLHKVCRAFQNCFRLVLFESIARSSDFWESAFLHGSLSLVTFSSSTTASVVSFCGIGWRFLSAARALFSKKLVSTVDARAQRCSCAIQAQSGRLSAAEARDGLVVSGTSWSIQLRPYLTDFQDRPCLTFQDCHKIPQRIQMSG